MQSQRESWQVSVNEQIYETTVEEMREWIGEGSLLPQDKVRRGNLRWLEAGKVPSLLGFFNAKELGLPMPILQTVNSKSLTETSVSTDTTNTTFQSVEANDNSLDADNGSNFPTANHDVRFESPPENVCFVHRQSEPFYVCGGCANLFCKKCPQSYGASVKICPLCGAMCEPLATLKTKREKICKQQFAASEGFGFGDIGRGFAYPFRFKTSLAFGAVMFMFFTVGESAAAFGGMFMMFAAIFCYMLANTLTFGILANTIENFARGEIDKNFMPDFDEFNLWDDVVHPFFLSVGAYLVSFGFLAALAVGAAFYVVKNLPAAQKVSLQSAAVEIPAQELNVGNHTSDAGKIESSAYENADGLRKAQTAIENQRKAELESIAEKSPETQKREYMQELQSLAGFLVPLSLLAFLAMLWGVFYFPAACCVAGYTRSFAATINPLVGLDTIKRLGVDYAKILGIFVGILFVSLGVGAILGVIFAPLDLPQIGNLPVKVLGGLVSFYFSIVFSVSLGLALYKNSERLNLNRG